MIRLANVPCGPKLGSSHLAREFPVFEVEAEKTELRWSPEAVTGRRRGSEE